MGSKVANLATEEVLRIRNAKLRKARVCEIFLSRLRLFQVGKITLLSMLSPGFFQVLWSWRLFISTISELVMDGQVSCLGKEGKEMLNLGLNITRRCNLNCSHCYLSKLDIDLEVEFVKSLLVEYRPTTVSLTGGEPLLHERLDEILSMLVELDYVKRVYIYTNGLLLHRYKDILSSCGKVKLIISLYDVNQVQRVFSYLKCKKENTLPISINVVGYERNLRLLNFIDGACKIQEIFLLYPLRFPGNRTKIIQPPEWEKIVNIYKSTIKANASGVKFYYEKVFIDKDYNFNSLKEIYPPCKRKRDIFVDSDKNSYYCCLLASFKGMSFSGSCPIISFHKKFVVESSYLMICPLLLFDENDFPYGEHSYAMENTT